MEFKINSNELSKRLGQLTKVVLPKNVVPILDDVMIDIRGDVAVLTASDGELWLSLKCRLISSEGNTKLCVNAKDLFSLMSNIDSDVTIAIDEDARQITCNYGNGEFSMPYEQADEYPSSNDIGGGMNSVIVDGGKIHNAINMTEFAVSTNVNTTTLSPQLGGLHLSFGENGLCVSATDKFVVAIYNDNTIVSAEGDVTIPRKTVTVLSSILAGLDGDIKMSYNKSYISVNNSDFKLSSGLIELAFPNCKSVIPQTSTLVATVKKNDILLAIKRVCPMPNDISGLIVMTFENGNVTLSSEDKMYGKCASETVACDCNQSMKIGFKCSCLNDVIRNIKDDDITIELSDACRAGVFYAASSYTKNEFISLLSPLTLQ